MSNNILRHPARRRCRCAEAVVFEVQGGRSENSEIPTRIITRNTIVKKAYREFFFLEKCINVSFLLYLITFQCGSLTWKKQLQGHTDSNANNKKKKLCFTIGKTKKTHHHYLSSFKGTWEW